MDSQVFVDALYLLALINPVSKISVLAVLATSEQKQHVAGVVAKSSVIAAAILLGSMFFGDFVLRSVFHVDIHSLRVAGGMVLFLVGFTALRKGMFFEQESQARFADLAIVPLACPMIAGPATIAATITMASHGDALSLVVSLLIAILANCVLMLLARPIASVLTRFNILGALIRITGLIVMTIGVQMVLTGLQVYLQTAGVSPASSL
jgi:multiple antibiotic resistance protein